MQLPTKISNMRYLTKPFLYCPKRFYNERKAAECYLKSTINLQDELSECSKEITRFITDANPFNLLNQVKIDLFATKFKSKSLDVSDNYYVFNILRQYEEALSIYNRIYQTQKVFIFQINLMGSDPLEKDPFKVVYFEKGSDALEMLVEFASYCDPMFCAYWDSDVSQLYIGRRKEKSMELTNESRATCRIPKPRKIWISIDLRNIFATGEIEVLQTSETKSIPLLKIWL